jgi:YVTN family beta-propeller protein
MELTSRQSKRELLLIKAQISGGADRDPLWSQWRRLLPILAATLTTLLVCAGVSSRASAATAYRAYVANSGSDTVTPIELATNTAGTPIPVGTFPDEVAITPNGDTAYVTNIFGNTVTPIDVATNKAGTSFNAGEEPEGIAITPNGETAYVTNFNKNTVTPIELATNKPGTPIPVGNAPEAIAITPNGETAYVANAGSDTVTPINLASNTPGSAISVVSEPTGVAIAPNGETAYVPNFEGGPFGVTPINIATNQAGPQISAGTYPEGIAITPNGETAYVTNYFSKTVTPINLATNTAGSAIPVGETPEKIAITPNGETAYVTNAGSDTVTPINVATNVPGPAIPVGSGPVGITITTVTVAAPHWYSDGNAITEGTPEIVKTTGSLEVHIQPKAVQSIVKCKVKDSETIENPVGGGAGVDTVTGFTFSGCEAPALASICGKAKIHVIDGGLPWTTGLLAGSPIRDQISNLELAVLCGGTLVDTLKGSLQPQVGNSVLEFESGSGGLTESNGSGTATVTGTDTLVGPKNDTTITAHTP